MLKRLILKNFKCFEDNIVYFQKNTLLVGQNNSGKTSIVEALRYINLTLKKTKSTQYKLIPPSFRLESNTKGLFLKTEDMKITPRASICKFEEDYVAEIRAVFSDMVVLVMINSEIAVGILYDNTGKNIQSPSQANKLSSEQLAIMPPISSLLVNERLVSPETVKEGKDTLRSSRHFRNEIFREKEKYFHCFKRLVEDTWLNVKVLSISLEHSFDSVSSGYLDLLISDHDFIVEAGLLGNGLQSWLQIMWFLSKIDKESIVVLDEPDIYMHPDIQLKVYQYIKKHYAQTIVATHSVEIISNEKPSNIAVLDRNQDLRRRITYAVNQTIVQNAIDSIGGVTNLSLIRLGTYNCCLFVEGKDFKLLKDMYEIYTLDRNLIAKFQTLPTFQLGGFANVRSAFAIADFFRRQTKGSFICFCVLDSDYHMDDEIQKIVEEANNTSLHLRVWSKKEIENYIFTPAIVLNYLCLEKPNESNLEYRLNSMISNVAEKMKSDLIYSISDSVMSWERKSSGKHLEFSTCHKRAIQIVDSRWNTIEEKLSMLSGKEFGKLLKAEIENIFGLRMTLPKLLNKINRKFLDAEITSLFDDISERLSKLG